MSFKIAVPGLGHHRQRPRIAFLVRRCVLYAPCNDRIAHHADAVGVGDHHRAVEKARIFEPGGSGHFAVAVQREPAGEDRILRNSCRGEEWR